MPKERRAKGGSGDRGGARPEEAQAGGPAQAGTSGARDRPSEALEPGHRPPHMHTVYIEIITSVVPPRLCSICNLRNRGAGAPPPTGVPRKKR
jgi:hypothetical protein